MSSNHQSITHATLRVVADTSIPWFTLASKSVLITGATGLIGGLLIRSIIKASERLNLNIRVIAATRNESKARIHFSDLLGSSSFNIIQTNSFAEWEQLSESFPAQYIIHCANETQSRNFIRNPVGVIVGAFEYCSNILKFSQCVSAKSFIFLSTLEVYGTHIQRQPINETTFGSLDPTAIRNSYPESKRICEALCVGYHSQYNTPVKIARLTQTFGPGISWNDSRVFAEFARNACKGEDILLLTDGMTRRDYLYVTDAVSAILLILIKGVDGQSYNISNNNANRSVRELAETFAYQSLNQKSKVIYSNDAKSADERGFAPCNTITLDTTKIEKLGWKPQISFEMMISLLLNYFKEISA